MEILGSNYISQERGNRCKKCDTTIKSTKKPVSSTVSAHICSIRPKYRANTWLLTTALYVLERVNFRQIIENASLPEMDTSHFYTGSCSIQFRILLFKQLNTEFNYMYLISRKHRCIKYAFSVKIQLCLKRKIFQPSELQLLTNTQTKELHIPFFLLHISCTLSLHMCYIAVDQKQTPKSDTFKLFGSSRITEYSPCEPLGSGI